MNYNFELYDKEKEIMIIKTQLHILVLIDIIALQLNPTSKLIRMMECLSHHSRFAELCTIVMNTRTPQLSEQPTVLTCSLNIMTKKSTFVVI